LLDGREMLRCQRLLRYRDRVRLNPPEGNSSDGDRFDDDGSEKR
jgi:hypothetical protein